MPTACTLVSSPQHAYPGHSEGPERFSGLQDWQSRPYAKALLWLEPHPAGSAEVRAVHSERMLHDLAEVCKQGPGIIDLAPTYVTPSSFDDALAAAGGTLACSRAVLDGTAHNAFALVRPPGHHAEPDRPMGFCLLNNLAIAATDALAHGIRKILIFDFDAHHGNGTQAAFWGEERAAYFSTHQENIYPGSGQLETAPHARGRIVNLPLPARSGDAAFALVAREVLTPLVRGFAPEMIFVSAGFDAHWRDPLTALGLSTAGFAALSDQLVALAEETCRGRIVFVLEGGYDARVVALGAGAVLEALTNAGTRVGASTPTMADPSPYPEPDIRPRLDHLLRLHQLRQYQSI
jgi:acetoin utilization deacetylase AcuC-like enzyme